MAAPRSRFFAEASDSEESSEATSQVDAPAAGGGGAKGKPSAPNARPANRFQMEESESESEDEGRVVRSEKDKKFEALLTITTAIRNQLRIANWVEVQDGALRGARRA
jgi:translation initiation factor 3 subunit C